jgi:hypothetical protein
MLGQASSSSSESRSASKQQQQPEDSLLDMIGSYENRAAGSTEAKAVNAASSGSKQAEAKKK